MREEKIPFFLINSNTCLCMRLPRLLLHMWLSCRIKLSQQIMPQRSFVLSIMYIFFINSICFFLVQNEQVNYWVIDGFFILHVNVCKRAIQWMSVCPCVCSRPLKCVQQLCSLLFLVFVTDMWYGMFLQQILMTVIWYRNLTRLWRKLMLSYSKETVWGQTFSLKSCTYCWRAEQSRSQYLILWHSFRDLSYSKVLFFIIWWLLLLYHVW